jgi:AcrR family transcriptional regulator
MDDFPCFISKESVFLQSPMNKGLETRMAILDASRDLFNRMGCELTIAQIATEIGHGKSKVSNHFPRKNELIFAILETYEEQLGQFINEFAELEDRYTFLNHARLLDKLMDLMFEYRGVIAYSLTAPKKDRAMMMAVRGRYATNRERLKSRLQKMVQRRILNPAILEAASFQRFEVQYMNLLTTWFITLELYYGSENYSDLKTDYIKSVLNSYSPHLTRQGKDELDAAFLSLDQKVNFKEHNF